MNTKPLMVASALAMGAAGLALTFLPQELLTYLQVAPAAPLPILVQLTGALYLSFALLNWMAKASLIGGIYSRPVAMGNFLHFAMGALLLLKAAANGPSTAPLWAVGAVYGGFAVLFALVLLRHPLRRGDALSGKGA